MGVSAMIGCEWLREISCHSDRDQVSFPFVLHQLGLHSRQLLQLLHQLNSTTMPSGAAKVFADKNDDPWVAVIAPQQHHWYSWEEVARIKNAVYDDPNHQRKSDGAHAKGSRQRLYNSKNAKGNAAWADWRQLAMKRRAEWASRMRQETEWRPVLRRWSLHWDFVHAYT